MARVAGSDSGAAGAGDDATPVDAVGGVGLAGLIRMAGLIGFGS